MYIVQKHNLVNTIWPTESEKINWSSDPPALGDTQDSIALCSASSSVHYTMIQ